MRLAYQLHASRTLAIAVMLVPVMLVAGFCAAGESRQWTYQRSKDGNATKFEAEFLGLEGVTVVLQGKDGKRYKPPLANLSQDDNRYVEKLSQTDAGDFVDWVDGLGNELKVRYVGVAGQSILLVTEQGGSMQVPWDRLHAKQRAYVIQAQQAAVTAKALTAEAARKWTRVGSIEMVTLNADEIPDRDREITFLNFSADSSLLLSASKQETAVWSVVACRKQCQLQSNDEQTDRYGSHFHVDEFDAKRFSFDPTGARICYLPRSKAMFQWDAVSGRPLTRDFDEAKRQYQQLTRTFGRQNEDIFLNRLACSPDRKLVAVAICGDDTGVWLVNPESWDRLERMNGAEEISWLSFSPDGKTLVAQVDERRVHVWDLATKRHQLVEARYSSDKFAGVADNAKAVAFQSSGEIMFFNASSGTVQKKYELVGKEKEDGRAWVSPVGSLVAFAYGGTVYLDDWATAESKATLTSHEANITWMQFSSDGSLLATGDAVGRIKLWKIGSLTNTLDEKKPSSTGEASPVTNSLPAEPRMEGVSQDRMSLFDGKSLSGWSLRDPDHQNWRTENDSLVYHGDTKNDLVTDRVFQDFDLHLEFLLEPGANSGVYLRGRYEVQLNDSFDLDKQSTCGAVWDLIAPEEQAYRGASVWNTLDIRLVDREVSVVLNGLRVISSRRIPHTTPLALDTNENQPGPIMLQGWAGVVRFRNVWIRPHSSTDSSAN